MPKSWRITKEKYASRAFDGEGARLQGGRWSSPGTPIVYTAGSQSLAILEIVVHLQQSEFLSHYVVFELEFAEKMVEELDPALLPKNWRASPVPQANFAIGDRWIRNASSAVLRVPSVLVPSEFNYLLNPAHKDFSTIKIGSARPLDLDARLLKK